MGKVYLANSAIVRNDGVYSFRLLSLDEFVHIAKEANDKGTLESYIGYPDTARMLTQVLGFDVPVRREMLPEYTKGDIVMGCRLKYRVANPADKGKFTPKLEDFEFWVMEFSPLDEEG